MLLLTLLRSVDEDPRYAHNPALGPVAADVASTHAITSDPSADAMEPRH